MSTGVNTSGKIKPSVRRNPWIRRAPGPAVRLSSLQDSDRLDCVVRDGGWAWGGRGGRRFGYGSDTLAPLRPDCVTAGRAGFARLRFYSNGQLVVLCVLTLLDALSYELRK